MRRRKNKKVFIRNKGRAAYKDLRADSSSQQLAGSSELQKFSFSPSHDEKSPSGTYGSPVGLGQSLTEIEDKTLLETNAIRKVLQKVTGANAVLTWVVSVVGYFDVRDSNESLNVNSPARDSLRLAMCLLSLIQIAIIVCYSYCFLQYSESLRVALRLSPIPVATLWRSPRAMIDCAMECAFHLLVLPPRVSVQRSVHFMKKDSLLSLSDLLYMFILLRNYHSLRFLFWYSNFSTRRTRLFVWVASIDFNSLFVLRCYLASYSLKLVFGVYMFIVFIAGVTVFVLEKGTPGGHFDEVENGLWLVSYTQATIGYGEIVPTTFFGQVSMIVSCFIGNFILSTIIGLSSSQMALNLNECTLYSELAYARFKRKYSRPAALLIQKWWRFMVMRQRFSPNAHTIIQFYSQLRVYREVITSAQRVKDRRFERQINAFQASTTRNFRAVTEYLQPIRTAETLVPVTQTSEIIRSQYRIKLMIQKMYKATRRHRPRKKSIDATSVSSVSLSGSPEPPHSHSLPKVARGKYSPSPRGGTKGLAKAKLRAHQKLIGRLLREEAPPSPGSPYSASLLAASSEL